MGNVVDPKVLVALGTSVERRSGSDIWRAFLVAESSVRAGNRRREMTTQRLFLIGDQRER